MKDTVQCYGCLGEFVKSTQPCTSHPYIGSVKECWLTYSEILAKEFGDKEYFKVHRTTVDSYVGQHIGDQNDRRARQSANVHLIALYLYFEKRLDIASVLQFLKDATARKRDWPSILKIREPKWLTINDILKAKNATEHAQYVEAWGKSVWNAYADQHQDIIRTYKKTKHP